MTSARAHAPLVHRRGALDLGQRPAVMAVLNVTPDSFSDGGRFNTVEQAVAEALRLVALGADIIDVGGESTRPGALPVSAEEEVRRVVPVIERLRQQSDVVISVDTCKASVARAAVAAGADIVNDVTAGVFDTDMFSTCAALSVGVVLMHTPVAPDQTHRAVAYDSIVDTVRAHLEARLHAAVDAGIDARRIALDPGFGFGKDAAQNFELANGLERIVSLGAPVLVGVSRKRMIRQTLRPTPLATTAGTESGTEAGTEAGAAMATLDAASAALALLLVTKGARIVRAHDVVATASIADLCEALGRHPA